MHRRKLGPFENFVHLDVLEDVEDVLGAVRR